VKVPALLKRKLKDCPWRRIAVSNKLPGAELSVPLVTVCPFVPWIFHVTVVPARTVMEAGEKKLSPTVIVLPVEAVAIKKIAARILNFWLAPFVVKSSQTAIAFPS
jgi:hypothetical protein